MSPYRLALCLLTIGWSERELVRRSGEHRNTVRRWLAGDGTIDAEVATWLEILAAVHLANPGPRRKKRARASTAAAVCPGHKANHKGEPGHRAAISKATRVPGKKKPPLLS